jgi:flavoprotein
MSMVLVMLAELQVWVSVSCANVMFHLWTQAYSRTSDDIISNCVIRGMQGQVSFSRIKVGDNKGNVRVRDVVGCRCCELCAIFSGHNLLISYMFSEKKMWLLVLCGLSLLTGTRCPTYSKICGVRYLQNERVAGARRFPDIRTLCLS